MEGEPLAERTYNHIAFQIDENDIDKSERLACYSKEENVC